MPGFYFDPGPDGVWEISGPDGYLGEFDTEEKARAFSAAMSPPSDAELSPADLHSRHVTIPYTNWRGEFAERKIVPIKLFWGSSEWHPEPQWLIEAWDTAKSEIRVFSLKGIGATPPSDPAIRATDRAEAFEEAAKIAEDQAEEWFDRGDGDRDPRLHIKSVAGNFIAKALRAAAHTPAGGETGDAG